MLQVRYIPMLLLKGESLVKTVQFKNPIYIGDPINTVRIFNENEADELILLDIDATADNREPDYDLLGKIAEECFIPLCYGGGIKTMAQAKRIFSIGFEKLVVNTAAHQTPEFITELASKFGSQAVIGVIDVRKNFFGRKIVVSASAKKQHPSTPVEWAMKLQDLGAGELMVTSVDREGTWTGLDIELIKSVTSAVEVPVIAHGGAGSINDVSQAIHTAHASAVALGSMVVFQKKGMGVLVNFPSQLREVADSEKHA